MSTWAEVAFVDISQAASACTRQGAPVWSTRYLRLAASRSGNTADDVDVAWLPQVPPPGCVVVVAGCVVVAPSVDVVAAGCVVVAPGGTVGGNTPTRTARFDAVTGPIGGCPGAE